MSYAGIDWSMSGPSICVLPINKKLLFTNCQIFFSSTKKKNEKDIKNLHGFLIEPYSCDEERFDNLSNWAIKILKANKTESVCMEGYSMGSKGQVYNIGENGGLLKHKLWKSNISFINPPPTTVKKFFSGKGNAKKDFMFHALVEREPECSILPALLECKIDSSPLSDVVDSYAMLDYLLNNMNSKV